MLTQTGDQKEMLTQTGDQKEMLTHTGDQKEMLTHNGDEEEMLTHNGDQKEMLAQTGGKKEMLAQTGGKKEMLAQTGGKKSLNKEGHVGAPFNTGEEKKIFPLYHPHNLIGNTFMPIKGAPHRGPGCYTTDTRYDWVYNLSKIPTSKKGYTLGARTAVRFKPIKDLTPHPAKYQTINIQEGKHKQNFAPFNVMSPQFMKPSKNLNYPGPDLYNPVKKSPPKVTWPMKFGAPDWEQIPCLRKRTLKAELPTDKDFRRYRNRIAYLSLFYNSDAWSSFTCSS